MLDSIRLTDILFLDIETVPEYPSFDDMPEPMQGLWEKKSSYFRGEDEAAFDVYNRAGIYAEFGKVVCISVGMVNNMQGEQILRLKSFFSKDEKALLNEFIDLVTKLEQTRKNIFLCAHNGKEFDFPYLARRMLINELALPVALDVAGKKPWEVSFIDTMELWKFGDYKHYTSLDLLANVFKIPTPKDDIDGSMVGKVFWEEDDLNRIVRYCEKDVITIVQLFNKYRRKPLIPDGKIVSTTFE